MALVLFFNLSYSQITVNSAGRVGIATPLQVSYGITMSNNIFFYNGIYPGLKIDGTSTNCNYGLTIYPATTNTGNIGKSNFAFSHIYSYSGVVETSDSRQKENIKNIPNALDVVMKLQGVKYDLKKEYAYSDSLVTNKQAKEKYEKQRKNQIGFLAQDVNKVLPEVVLYDDSTDIYGVVYSRFVPVLVEAIKEQQAQIIALKEEIGKLKSANNLKSAPFEAEETIETAATLNQNIPNPFTENTRINIYLPNNVNKAVLYVYNMQGVQIKSYSLQQRGNTAVTIEGSSLKAGLYLYTLVADGKEVDTKKMILTK